MEERDVISTVMAQINFIQNVQGQAWEANIPELRRKLKEKSALQHYTAFAIIHDLGNPPHPLYKSVGIDRFHVFG